jgi:hypothetical protein
LKMRLEKNVKKKTFQKCAKNVKNMWKSVKNVESAEKQENTYIFLYFS